MKFVSARVGKSTVWRLRLPHHDCMNFTGEKFEGVWERRFENIWLWERRKGRIQNKKLILLILCLRFRASLIYINNCPTRCNTKQSIYYSAGSLYMFRVSTTSVIRNTQNCNYSLRYCAATSLQRGQAWPRWREVAVQKIWSVPEAVVTVLCTPYDGCGWHPIHVEWTCRIINRLLCVASRWTIISIRHFFVRHQLLLSLSNQ